MNHTTDNAAPASSKPDDLAPFLRFTVGDFAEAFPGALVQSNGRPNKMRRAMHLARGLQRAVALGHIDTAAVYFKCYLRAMVTKDDPIFGGRSQALNPEGGL